MNRRCIESVAPRPPSLAPRPSRRLESVAVRRVPRIVLLLVCLANLLGPAVSHAHHFKGLPHYNYYENYPQVPEEEFLGQAGEYELSLVVYDFQGINREQAETPDKVRLFLLIFDLLDNRVYQGPLTMKVLDGERVVQTARFDSADLENIYSLHRDLPDTGDYSLRVILHGENDLECMIPFVLSSQKVHWGRWIGLVLLVLVVVAAVGARRARVAVDRREAHQRARQRGSDGVAGKGKEPVRHG